MDHTRLKIDINPDHRDVECLKDRVDTFNVDETRIYDFKELAILLKDAAGQMYVGSNLMRAAEQEAIARGCHVATLETHSFQAPGFYKKLGYEEIGVLDEYPIHHKKYYLKKILSAP